MNKELLIKYLNNNCSETEFEEFAEWLKENTQNSEVRNQSAELWKSLEPDLNEYDNKKYSALLHKIHHEINLKQQGNSGRKPQALKMAVKWLSRAAAILFIPLLGIVFYLLSNRNFQAENFVDLTVDSLEVIAPVGSRTVLRLSDGTKVHLNYGSRIKYPRNFTGDIREITLMGEGYFDVVRNPKKPFVVKAGNLKVKALGTEFNVEAYPDDHIISTTLVEGKVVIDKILQKGITDRVGAMEPGQHVAYNTKTEKIISGKGNIEKYIAWKNGKMVFDNEPITNVARELSRKFNVDIEVADEIKDLTYTVTFADDPLFLILDLMTETTPVTYKRFPRKKRTDGTFSKQKIRIEKRE